MSKACSNSTRQRREQGGVVSSSGQDGVGLGTRVRWSRPAVFQVTSPRAIQPAVSVAAFPTPWRQRAPGRTACAGQKNNRLLRVADSWSSTSSSTRKTAHCNKRYVDISVAAARCHNEAPPVARHGPKYNMCYLGLNRAVTVYKVWPSRQGKTAGNGWQADRNGLAIRE